MTLGRRDVVRLELVSVAEVMERIQRLLKSSLGRRVRLQVAVPGSLPPVFVDPRQLEQVVLNLAINARDAMPEGGELTIFAEQGNGQPAQYRFATSAKSPDHAIRLHVRDTGIGIEESLLPRLFEPFFTTKDAEHGTGLGLAVVRAFADSCGGRIGVDSEAGRGSTFTLEIPVASPAQVADGQVVQVPLTAPSPGTSVLVADDDPRVRQSIVSELRSAGYEVIEAEDGQAALESAERVSRIHLLCTDAVMPRLGGEELIRRFRQLHPAARVLVCSAYVQDEGLRQLVNRGQYAALPKPFAPSDLRGAVARALAGPAPSPVEAIECRADQSGARHG